MSGQNDCLQFDFDSFLPGIKIDNFIIKQNRLLFEDYVEGGRVMFSKVSTEYSVTFERSKSFSLGKVPLIIPIKDLPELLDYTLTNLATHDADSHANVIVVDDRSSEPIKEVCEKHEFVSYVRCDYSSTFNYSMLANISALIAIHFGFSEIIYWNSDMYLPDNKVLPLLIEKHRRDKPAISGTKLLYPIDGWKNSSILKNETNINKTMREYQEKMREHFKGKIQFGGQGFKIENNKIKFFHFCRGRNKDDIYVNVDKACYAVTGAYMMMDLKWLRSVGGFNPSLAKMSNDIDICLRACEDRKPVMYYGKDTYLFHEESMNLNNNLKESKIDHQFNNDEILFPKLWNLERFNKAIEF